MTASIQAKYLAAGMALRDTQAHQADSDGATSVLDGAGNVAEDHDALGEQVAGIVESQLGIGA